MFQLAVVQPMMTVFSKIANFLDPVDMDADRSHWFFFSENVAPGRFVVWLANEVSLEILMQGTASEQLAAAVKTKGIGLLQADAERFLSHRYPATERANRDRLVTLFRALLEHRLRHIVRQRMVS